jgi:pentatricopeptide repeat protein
VKCLDWMRDLYRLGDEAARPDAIKYTTCISALAKKGQSDQAEALLDQMRADYLRGNEKAQPDSKVYEIVVNSCWGNKADGARAERLLRQMWALHSTHRNIRPTSSTYRSVIVAMKKTNHPDRAEALLDEMDRFYVAGELDEGPSEQLFMTVINAWNNSQHADRKLRASKLYQRMQKRSRIASV